MMLQKSSQFMKQANLINGEWVAADSGKTIDVINPATGLKIGTVPNSGKAETRRAIDAAAEAFKTWRKTSVLERSKLMRKLHDAILDNQDALAELLTLEQGKSLTEAKGEIGMSAAYILWYAEEARRTYGDVVPSPWADRRILVGIPKGVVNILTGSASEIGGEITSNPLVRKITFTGSTEIGKILIKQAADTVKKSGIYDAFVEKFAAATDKLKVGNGLDAGTQQGPLIDDKAVAKVEEFIADAKQKGGRIVTGGKRHALGGSFFEPTVIGDATPDMLFTTEEIFGPVAPIYKFETEQEAIDLANNTQFGLASYFYTQDLGRVFRVSEGLKYGMVGVNEGMITTVEAPFGGLKESGLGKEGGHQGIEDYLDTKYICVGGLGL
eukprot:gene9845-12080_t